MRFIYLGLEVIEIIVKGLNFFFSSFKPASGTVHREGSHSLPVLVSARLPLTVIRK